MPVLIAWSDPCPLSHIIPGVCGQVREKEKLERRAGVLYRVKMHQARLALSPVPVPLGEMPVPRWGPWMFLEDLKADLRKSKK